MAREIATAYTGANVSITIGSDLITNAFGISWELSQNKRPIYGYNSMHYDSVATGQVIVLGQLYLNYQHPNYLSRVLYDYFQEKQLAYSGTLGTSASETWRAGGAPMKTLFTDSEGNDLPAGYIRESYRGGANRQANTYSDVLENLHNDASLRANYASAFSSGAYFSSKSLSNDNGQAVRSLNVVENEGSLGLSQNLSAEGKRSIGSIYARPDHFTNNEGLRDQINIVITHGTPALNGTSAGILSYMPSSSIILRGVHFIGESQQVMSDDQPIMETYKFIARVKETLISKPETTEE